MRTCRFARTVLCAIALLASAGQAAMSEAAAPQWTAIDLIVGKSTLLDFPEKLTRVSISDPGIATAVVLSPTQLQMNGKSPGATTLAVWDEQEQAQLFDVDVQADLSQVVSLIRQVAPTDPIGVYAAQNSIVLTGEVARPTTIARVQEVAQTFTPSVVNLLRVSETSQIMLKVRFVEINRTAFQNIGLDFVVQGDAGGHPYVAVSQVGKGGVAFDKDTASVAGLLFPEASQFFGTGSAGGGSALTKFGSIIQLLQQKDLLRVLAEPNLLAKSGEEASFLAGGELPIPLVTANSLSVEWKEFGIRLTFTPEVTESGAIKLTAAPEVSSLDFANAVTVGGFTIPALRSRKTQTTVELRDGETLIIGGLLSQETTKVAAKIPMAADIPVLGDLFKSNRFRKGESELLVLVSPSLVRPSRAIPTKPLQADQDLGPFLGPGRTPFSDAQGERLRRSFGAERDAIWEPEREADPFLKRQDEWEERFHPSSGTPRLDNWSSDPSLPQDPESHSTLQKYKLATEDPAYQQIPNVLRQRLWGPPGVGFHQEEPYSLWKALGYRSPSSW